MGNSGTAPADPPASSAPDSPAAVYQQMAATFASFLTSKGLKFTVERRSILARCTELVGQFVADDLISGPQPLEARSRNVRVSKATIYRTLSLLVDAGILHEHRFTQNKAYYQLVIAGAPCASLICLRCGRILDYSTDRIEAIRDEACLARDFTASYYHLQIFGTCATCRDRPPETPEPNPAARATLGHDA